MWQIVVTLLLERISSTLAQNFQNVPSCATSCYTNATTASTACSNLDIKCLCTDEEYVNTLSCCLATSCSSSDQQAAISFNLKTCATVNETAPSFVGCSPLGVGSAAISFDTAAATSKSTTSSKPSNARVLTINGNVESALTSFIGTKPVTATFTGAAILTGSCTVPFFAAVTDSMAMVTQYPEIGCSHDQEGCCPYDSHQNAVLTTCPHDFFTTSGACCPSGWQVYTTNFGGQTPCYTVPSVAYVPSANPTGTGVAVITDHLFSRRYELATGMQSSSLSSGAIGGVAVGAVLAIALFASGTLFWLRKKKALRVTQNESAIEPSYTGDKPPDTPRSPNAHELPSPHSGSSPKSAKTQWQFFPPSDGTRTPPRQVVQELPGSTFINENHPVYRSADNSARATPDIEGASNLSVIAP